VAGEQATEGGGPDAFRSGEAQAGEVIGVPHAA
jgi:hypothetical protein